MHAKIAATEASFLPLNQVPISLPDAKAAIKKHTLHLWQKSWINNNTGCHLYDIQPNVSRKSYRSLFGRKAESKVNRLKMGHSLLKQHLHRIAIIDNPTCDRGTDRETPKHTIFHCQNNAVHRDILIDTIFYCISNTNPR